MAISIKNKEIIYQLLKLNRRIQKAYAKMDSNNFAKLLSLLDQESFLLTKFVFSNTSVCDVEKLFESQIAIKFKTEIPYCMNAFLTDDTYPYFRLIARLRYVYRKNSKKFENFIIPFEQDVEIAIFYRSLICDSGLHLGYKNALYKVAINALIESPTTEKAIIQNGMNPLEQVFDCLPFQLELWTAYHTKRVYGEIQVSPKENLLELKQRRFDILFNESNTLIKKYIDLLESGEKSQLTNFLVCVCFLKTLITLQEPEKRKELFDTFNKPNACIFENDGFYDFVEYSKVDIEELLVPTVTKVNYVYRPLKK